MDIWYNNYLKFLLLVLIFSPLLLAKRHQLIIKNDDRPNIVCSNFGFLKNSYFVISFHDFTFKPHNNNSIFGFTLDSGRTSTMNSYLESKTDTCILKNSKAIQDFPETSVLFLQFHTSSSKPSITIKRVGNRANKLAIYATTEDKFVNWLQLGMGNELNSSSQFLKINNSLDLDVKQSRLSFNIVVHITSTDLSGLYSLYFHNCQTNTKVNFTLDMVEKNEFSFLSAGRQNLPYILFAFCVLYIILAIFWFFYLQSAKSDVFKIHYLMLLLIFFKAIALLFHGINNFILGKKGIHEQGWAVMYYITHLMKGALLFTTILLIGTGWLFVKHVFSDREKKIFLIVVPLQILANVATIVIDETEEGTSQYSSWKEIFILVDLLCCFIVLIPVLWSIRHLQEATQSDGKAAVSLTKLRLFRHFYIIIFCYIYFTRLMVYLLGITVPFQYTWLIDLFREASTLTFFIFTGRTFRPISNNPYLLLPMEETDNDPEINNSRAAEGCGLTDNVTHLKRNMNKVTKDDDDEPSNSYDRVRMMTSNV